MTNLVRTNSDNADFWELIALLDADLAVRDGAEHSFYAQFNKVDAIRHIVVAYENGEAVGCGAIKEYERGVAEIKRMFVKNERRGRGIAGEILAELETWARVEFFRMRAGDGFETAGSRRALPEKRLSDDSELRSIRRRREQRLYEKIYPIKSSAKSRRAFCLQITAGF